MRLTLPVALMLGAALWTPSTDAQNPPPPPPPSPRRILASDVFFTGPNDVERAFLNSRNPGFIIARDFQMAGWVVRTMKNIEDFKFGILPDPDYIASRYGAPNSFLASAMLPGHIEDVPLIPKEIASTSPIAAIAAAVFSRPAGPVDPARRLPFADVAPNGSPRGVTINSFLLAQSSYLEVELNKWYVNKTVQGPYQFSGRGPAPAGWVQDYAEPWVDANAFWAFDPAKPDGTPLNLGDYVILHGTLWQDGGHVDGWACSNLGGFPCSGEDQKACWNRGEIPPDPPAWRRSRWMEPNGGWVEIHPVDAIVHAARPRSPRAARMVSLCAPVEAIDASRVLDITLSPTHLSDRIDTEVNSVTLADFAKPPGSQLHVDELIDGRYTDMRTVDEHSVRVAGDNALVHVKVHSSGTLSGQGKEGRFKASYILSWIPLPPPAKQLIATMTPTLVNKIGSPTAVTVHAEDPITRAGVSGTVRVNGAPRGATDAPLSLTLCTRPGAPKGEVREIKPAIVTVTAPGYAEARVNFECKGE
ncbi:MAG: hypothetical protein M3068_09590 [Gemmatimonadota bacterium]|nr:hypothetical protein [Gemmatimonadota bacterium]